MAAELTTGSLLIKTINQSGHNVSMLVVENKSFFFKKATGKIIFQCNEGKKIQNLINSLNHENNKGVIDLKSTGFDSNNIKVSEFTFNWSLKIRD